MLSLVIGTPSSQRDIARCLRSSGYAVVCADSPQDVSRVIIGPITATSSFAGALRDLIPLNVVVTVLTCERDVWRCACAAMSRRGD